ncbi:glycerol-3-phosphate 1-O-acyltransferase PlsY [Metallumcola ferriviriculae]|uniref:Glycerol-3-phosphate acyltransferase n=1 Tax=Metallumcola ferriviriculae TaxID=3039180 RepID=A0AAU0URT6_9FIRM|nr:glycerol-3-phosphate 1-O-acyltransferase PlsY [Desulfitibacteraceae bacterium MK1]
MIKLLVLLFSYLLGSIPMAYMIGKFRYGKDIRKYGSGNVGATNAFRILGPAAGITVLAADALKGFLAVLIAGYFGGPFMVIAAGFIVIFGHTFSAFLKFRGGKGVATGAGTFLAIAPKSILWAVLIFVLIVLLFRFVSLGSISGAASLPVLLFIYQRPWAYVIYGLVAAAFVIFKHRSNIERLRNGLEPKITWRF